MSVQQITYLKQQMAVIRRKFDELAIERGELRHEYNELNREIGRLER